MSCGLSLAPCGLAIERLDAEGDALLIVARPVSKSAACPACGSVRVTSLEMTLTDGTPVDFASCHDCEHRAWTHEGEALTFRDVITRATKPLAANPHATKQGTAQLAR